MVLILVISIDVRKSKSRRHPKDLKLEDGEEVGEDGEEVEEVEQRQKRDVEEQDEDDTDDDSSIVSVSYFI